LANTGSISTTNHTAISSISSTELQQQQQHQRQNSFISTSKHESNGLQSKHLSISTINQRQCVPIYSPFSVNEIIFSTDLYYQNVNGLLSKRTVLYAEILAADFPIYVFTETALNDTVPSHEIFPPNYCVYRCDRTKNTSEKQSKGGTLIAVHNRFSSELISTGENVGCEHLWIKISNNTQNIIIGSLYIPPASKPERYLRNMNYAKSIIEKANSDTTVILLGDFNLTNLNWIKTDELSNTFIPTNITSDEENITMDSCHDLGLNQINYHRNDNNRLLDLIWTNDPDNCSCIICPNHLLKNEIHHKALTLEMSFHLKKESTTKTILIKDFLGADYQQMNDHLQYIEWNNIFAECSFEKKIDEFYKIINSVILTLEPLAGHSVPKTNFKVNLNTLNQLNITKLRFFHMYRLHTYVEMYHTHYVYAVGSEIRAKK